AQCVVAGGMESMSNIPFYATALRAGWKMGDAALVDGMIRDGLWDKYNDFHMGMTAELVADKHKISRREQDEFALASHQKAVAAAKAGKFRKEIVAVEIPGKKGPTRVETDETPREDTTLEALAKLRPAFKPDGGTVTAGNAPGVNDGAAALVVVSDAFARQAGLKPLARITGYAVGGLDPQWVMLAPLEAVKNLNRKLGVKCSYFDLVELNEAFAVAAIALVRELELDPRKVNVHGGAVALGHPIGASGARILTTLLHALADRGLKRGLAGLCLGGGNAVALSVEMT
ncbi:MAG: acetyl-CoA C-acyltransferase, partial [Planctomycetes bacterium]|nr:acetyl-CoA C-acyltransferase [Planctomycetota bacterium]